MKQSELMKDVVNYSTKLLADAITRRLMNEIQEGKHEGVTVPIGAYKALRANGVYCHRRYPDFMESYADGCIE